MDALRPHDGGMGAPGLGNNRIVGGFVGENSHSYLEDHPRTCKWLVSPIYKQFKLFGRGITPVRGLTNHGY